MLKKWFSRQRKDADTSQPLKGQRTLSSLLHGLRPGRLQSVGVMQIIPLLGELEDERFVSPAQAQVDTQGYGDLRFENTSDQTLLIPCHTGYVVKQAAQDHAMAHAALVPPKKQQNFRTAMCIQQTQGGYINTAQHKMMILPYALRETALDKREEQSFNKLWSEISAWNERFGLSTSGNLVTFLKHFEKQLDEFVAEFECVPQQQGAIILIGGEVVGIERAPSASFFASIWEALIRECYGSEAIATSQQLKEDSPVPHTRIPLRKEGISSLADLADALEEAEAQEEELARETVRALMSMPLQTTRDSTEGDLDIETLQADPFKGQLIRDQERICYASLFLSKRARKQQAWEQAAAFSI